MMITLEINRGCVIVRLSLQINSRSINGKEAFGTHLSEFPSLFIYTNMSAKYFQVPLCVIFKIKNQMFIKQAGQIKE